MTAEHSHELGAEHVKLRPNEAILNRGQVSRLATLNPLRFLLNPVTYREQFGVQGELFDPEQFDPIRVVWVQVSPTRKELLIQDGHHRLAAYEDNFDTITARFPNFQCVVRNVTHSFLDQATTPTGQDTHGVPMTLPDDLVIESTADEFPPALTVKRYMDISANAIQRHKEIVPLRVAALLMKQWRGIVGEDIEGDFSGLAALATLENPEIANASDEELRDWLKRQQFFSGETAPQRQTVQRGLMTIAQTLQEYSIPRTEAASSAFVIVSTQEEGEIGRSIGGSSAAKRQIAGLLHLPPIAKKMRAQFGSGEDLSAGIAQTATQITAASVANGPVTANDEIRPLFAALVDPSLPLKHFYTLLGIPPDQRGDILRRIYREERINRFIHQYKEVKAELNINGPLLWFEERAIDNIIGDRQAYGNTADLINSILGAQRARSQAQSLMKRVENSGNVRVEVRRSLIDKLDNAMRRVSPNMQGLGSLPILRLAITQVEGDLAAFHALKSDQVTLFATSSSQLLPDKETTPSKKDRRRNDRSAEDTPQILGRRVRVQVYRLASKIEDLPPEAVTQDVISALRKLKRAIDDTLPKEE